MEKEEFYKKMRKYGQEFQAGSFRNTAVILVIVGLVGILFQVVYFFYEQGSISRAIFIACNVFLFLVASYFVNRYGLRGAGFLVSYGQKMDSLSKNEPKWTKKERIVHVIIGVFCCILIVTILVLIIINQMHGGRGLIPAEW